MKTKVQHNVLTISEMTKRPNKMCAEIIDIDNIVLTEDLIRKLRASKSMFNKSTYVQILCGGVRYNVEGVDHLKNGKIQDNLDITTVLRDIERRARSERQAHKARRRSHKAIMNNKNKDRSIFGAAVLFQILSIESAILK